MCIFTLSYLLDIHLQNFITSLLEHECDWGWRHSNGPNFGVSEDYESGLIPNYNNYILCINKLLLALNVWQNKNNCHGTSLHFCACIITCNYICILSELLLRCSIGVFFFLHCREGSGRDTEVWKAWFGCRYFKKSEKNSSEKGMILSDK